MGYVLIPAEVREWIQEVIQWLEQLEERYQSAFAIIKEFSEQDDLEGKAYNKMKEGFLNYHALAVHGAAEAKESIQRDLVILEEAIGTDDLDEDLLEEQIGKQKKIIRHYEDVLDALYHLSRMPFLAYCLEPLIENNRSLLALSEDILDRLQEELEKLYEISNSTRGLFGNASDWFSAVSAAIRDLQVVITGEGNLSDGGWKNLIVPSYEEKVGKLEDLEKDSEEEPIDRTQLITLDSVTYLAQAMQNVDRNMSEEKLMTAIYLTGSILNDPELAAMGADVPWLCGVVANMLFEGQPGQLENYHYKSNPMPNYMKNAVSHGYDKAYDANGGHLSYAATIPELTAIIHCDQHEKLDCGFGYGMFQWTFERTGDVLGVLNESYGSRTDEITFEEVYAAEYTFFKKEITGTYSQLLTDYQPTGNAVEDAQNSASAFRKTYEGNSEDYEKAKELAEAWQKELEKVGVK